MKILLPAAAGLTLSLSSLAFGQPHPPAPMPTPPDLSKDPTLYVVGYAHLDTQWRWCYPQTIREFIPSTLNDNFKFFEKYQSYVFNFSGSRRYQMMQEYYPEGYEKLRVQVAAGRWFPCGSSVDENDANVPSAESIIRHVLYGNRFFRREFGVASDEYMLPDCFGFPAALPSVLAHCGIKGFSTQKLTWNAVVPIPFKVGVWQGPDGRSVIAALDPGNYVGEVQENLAKSNGWLQRINANGKKSGVFTDYHYYGTGDRGGAPTERSVSMVEESVHTQGPIKVVSGPADWMFKAITPEMREHLPTYQGELLLTEHSAGSITSEAYMKRWNRKNELLADGAERASVAAWWLGSRPYPAEKLEEAWTLVLGSQMHDILPGTSHPRAYDFSWNDELIALNEFGAVLKDAASAVAGSMNTKSDGTCLIIYNPLSVERQDVVEAEIPGDAGAKGVTVTGPDGAPVAAQILSAANNSVRIAFLAKAPSVGFAAYDVKIAPASSAATSALAVTERQLDNERYTVKLNDAGDVASIYDKQAKRELLSAPATLQLCYENPRDYPAWNQDWADRQLPVKETVGGPATFRIVENGPARVAVEVTRTLGPSTFHQTISLASGDAGNRVTFDTILDWAARERSLRAAFPLTVSNPNATYDIQTGVIERGNNNPKRYEAPSHFWFDLTDAKGDYGVTVMNDCKFGSDKPADNILRLTLMHTPGTRGGYQDQGTQDVGRHHIVYAIEGHTGDWRAGKSAQQAARLNQPIVPFIAASGDSGRHDGALGKSFSLARTSDDTVRINAIKKAEEGDEVIVRLRELSGKENKNARVALSRPIVSAREVDGQERPIGDAKVESGELVAPIGGYELRAYAVRLGDAPTKATAPQSASLEIPFDTDVATTNANRSDGAMTADGRSYPTEQLPASLTLEGVNFKLGRGTVGQKNALTCAGQELKLPAGEFDRLYILAASSDGDAPASITIDGKPTSIRFRQWDGFVGQWDHRLWRGTVPEQTFGWNNELGGIEPGWVKPEEVAWHCSHHHTPSGDAYYLSSYIFKYAIDLPRGAKSVRLPSESRVKIFAATAAKSGQPDLIAAAPLSDTLSRHTQDAPMIVPASGAFDDAVEVQIQPRLYFRDGAIRYTTDGSEPTADSPVYSAPFLVSGTTTVKAAIIDGAGKLGPSSSARIDVNDTTAPTVKRVSAAYQSPKVEVLFSEPVDTKASGRDAFVFDPPLEIKSVQFDGAGHQAVLALASAPATDKLYHLKISGIKDASPAHNQIKPASFDVAVHGPVYTLATISAEQLGKTIQNVPKLPVKAGDAWTFNVWVNPDKQPDNRTVIAGFGACRQNNDDGQGRYIAKFGRGVRFWSHNRDVDTSTPLDLNRWQMLTATYDGTTLCVYKDGKEIGRGNVSFADDQPIVNIAPVDPWDQKRRFSGDIRGISIFAEALSPEAVQFLHESSASK